MGDFPLLPFGLCGRVKSRTVRSCHSSMVFCWRVCKNELFFFGETKYIMLASRLIKSLSVLLGILVKKKGASKTCCNYHIIVASLASLLRMNLGVHRPKYKNYQN
jgi:hypothetical protein